MKLRVSAVQYHLHTIQSFDDFAKQVEHYVKNEEEYDADLDLELLEQVRESGSVTTWRDRRTDFYQDWE
jgi:hypothetical protein